MESAIGDDISQNSGIRVRPSPFCTMCGRRGEPLYYGLIDRVFDTPGRWNLKRCPDSACGLLWLDPIPVAEDIGKAYANYYTHNPVSCGPREQIAPPPRGPAEICRSAYRAMRFNYGEDTGKPFRWLMALPVAWSPSTLDEVETPLRYLTVPERGRMLDLGCGDGSVLKLASDLGWDAEGVDFDPDAVANARRKGLVVRAGALEEQNYPDDSFDLILMSHVIEHLHDPLRTLREIRRTLRRGGTLVVTTPNADSWGHRRFGNCWRGLEPPRHLQIFNARNLTSLVKGVGFARIVVSSTLRITTYVSAQSRLIRRRGHGDDGRTTPRRDLLAARFLTCAEMIIRLWNPLAADELLLEARRQP